MTRSLPHFSATSLTAVFLATSAMAEVPQVLTDIAPVASLVGMVMGDLGQPDILLPQGGDPHDYQLRPQQAASLETTDLLIWIGPELTPWLERARQNMNPDGHSLALLASDGTHLQDFASELDAHDDTHDHDHDHDHEHHADEAGTHSHDGLDPHAWLDPGNARHWLGVIAEELALIDPENAETYRSNAQSGAAAIASAEADIQNRLSPAKDKNYVVFHDAYGYFTAHFGLRPATAVSLSDASSPSAARISDIRAFLDQNPVSCAFPEANHDIRTIEIVIEGSTVRLGKPLDPSGSMLEPGPGLYAALLQGLGDNMAECLTAQ